MTPREQRENEIYMDLAEGFLWASLAIAAVFAVLSVLS